MAMVDHTFTVDAPPAVVFAYLTDPEKATVWQASLLEAHFNPDAPVNKAPTEIHEVRKLLGRKLESTVEVTEFEQVDCSEVAFAPVPCRGSFPTRSREQEDRPESTSTCSVSLVASSAWRSHSSFEPSRSSWRTTSQRSRSSSKPPNPSQPTQWRPPGYALAVI
jgi:hypothetical protein